MTSDEKEIIRILMRVTEDDNDILDAVEPLSNMLTCRVKNASEGVLAHICRYLKYTGSKTVADVLWSIRDDIAGAANKAERNARMGVK